MRWLRRESRPGQIREDDLRTAWQLVAVCLQYPTAEVIEQAPLLREAGAGLPAAVAAPLTSFIDDVSATPLRTLEKEYVDTFDVTRRCCLHLTYYTHGDTRRRGVALVEFKQAYRRGGAQIDETELPDYLPAVLEFGAAFDVDVAWTLLTGHRVSIELLNASLTERQSRWLPVVSALRATLPELKGTDEDALARLIAEGPPTEAVGTESYGRAGGSTPDIFADPRLNPRPATGAITEGAHA